MTAVLANPLRPCESAPRSAGIRYAALRPATRQRIRRHERIEAFAHRRQPKAGHVLRKRAGHRSTDSTTSTLDQDSAWVAAVRDRMTAWYEEARRDLPWRVNGDPYRILVSEMMLVQTTVTAVIPYFERFLGRFPDVRSLAAADEVGCRESLGRPGILSSSQPAPCGGPYDRR